MQLHCPQFLRDLLPPPCQGLKASTLCNPVYTTGHSSWNLWDITSKIMKFFVIVLVTPQVKRKMRKKRKKRKKHHQLLMLLMMLMIRMSSLPMSLWTLLQPTGGGLLHLHQRLRVGWKNGWIVSSPIFRPFNPILTTSLLMLPRLI